MTLTGSRLAAWCFSREGCQCSVCEVWAHVREGCSVL